jgi:dipeptidase E
MTAAREPTILAIGGGGCGNDEPSRLLDDYMLGLSGKTQPRICFIPTASGDNDAYLVRFYSAFSLDRCRPSHLALFQRSVRDVRSFLLAQDVIYVGGGNTAAMLAIWRQHGLDEVLREAWQQGIVLCGASAGGNCWFEACSTDSFGPWLDPLNDGLGLVAGSFCPHYDGEVQRRPTLERFISEGRLPSGYAADNYVGLHFTGTSLTEAVSSRPGAQAYKVEQAEGRFVETALAVRAL